MVCGNFSFATVNDVVIFRCGIAISGRFAGEVVHDGQVNIGAIGEKKIISFTLLSLDVVALFQMGRSSLILRVFSSRGNLTTYIQYLRCGFLIR